MSQRYLGGVITANPTAPTMTTESGVWTLEQQFQYTTTWSPKIVGNSLRFRSSASTYLSRTPASAGNQTTWTMSMWVKRGALGVRQFITMSGTNPNPTQVWQVEFDASDKLNFYNQTIGTYRLSTQVFRDPGAWYHIVFCADTYNTTAQNRFRCWVNGVEITAWDTNLTISSGYAFAYNGAYLHGIGAYTYSGNGLPVDGYMAEINFVGGQALTPSSFGAYDNTGVWQPLPYTGTYGTNGFYLTFADNSAATAAALGKDYSGNGNNWTPNNFSLTTGVTYDWMLDTPTNSDNGGTGRGNYAVLNPLAITSTARGAISDGNLTASLANSSTSSVLASFGMSSGKWYWEFTQTYSAQGLYVGIDSNPFAITTSLVAAGGLSTGYGYYNGNGNKANNNSSSAYGTAWYTSGQTYTIGVAFDADNGTLAFYLNGTSQGTAFTGLTSGPYYPSASNVSGSAGPATVYFNFGQRPFAYTPPTGFKALNTQNLSTPTIMNGAQVMAATTYSGNSSTQTISNGGNNTIGTTFKPDFVWVKSRNIAGNNHNLWDSVRGAGNALFSNLTNAEAVAANMTGFTSSGFSFSGVAFDSNTTGNNLIAWQWQAGQGTTSSNTSGSITSTVSVNATAGFSVVTYTGTGANATVGHGLGVAPKMVIVKGRSIGNAWGVWQTALAGTEYLILNTTAAKATAATLWNSTTPTSSVFSLGTDATVNGSASTYVAYCWAAVAGYSAFGSYTGNNSADGPFVYLGFMPRWVMIKGSSVASSWAVFDTSRNTYNVMGSDTLLANSSAASSNYPEIDFVSNGFKVRANDVSSYINGSGQTYVYAAFAENPFKIARAR